MKTAHDLVLAAKARVEELSLAEAEAAIRQADVLIDVREADEYAAGHLPGAMHLPRGLLEFKLSARAQHAVGNNAADRLGLERDAAARNIGAGRAEHALRAAGHREQGLPRRGRSHGFRGGQRWRGLAHGVRIADIGLFKQEAISFINGAR